MYGKGEGRNWFNENLRWRVGKDNKILFWMIVGQGK